jgi:hypothetical protein
MAALFITYDEKNPWLDYGGLVKAIKSHRWVRLTDNVYVIATDAPAQTVFEKLRQFLDDSANLYVISLKQPFAGFGPESINEWLVKNVGNGN